MAVGWFPSYDSSQIPLVWCDAVDQAFTRCFPNPFMSSPEVAAPRAPCEEPAVRFGVETQLSAFRSRGWISASLLGMWGYRLKLS